MRTVRLNWQVACRGSEIDSHAEFLASSGGLYVWVWNGKPARVIYVGETRNFYDRFVTHLSKMLGGEYSVFHMDENDDFVEFSKTHYAGKTIDEINSKSAIYVPTITSKKNSRSFSRMFFDDEMYRKRAFHLQLHSYAFATVEAEGSSVKEVEGALISSLYAKYESFARQSLMRKDSRSNQTLIGNINRYPASSLTIEHIGPAVAALPDEFREIVHYDLPDRGAGGQ